MKLVTFILLLSDHIEEPDPESRIVVEDFSFEWWYIIILLPLWFLGLGLNQYIRKNKYK